ncbi:nucleotidyl transferase AbiEii/AbiGii toxin family protein [Candidatus Gottesmanbacteria bacterium]|nr:nucleotidyl transferase AbiEii/AbiGii toxin family protein [Candidatus Gottesmanbacteria bacterium]
MGKDISMHFIRHQQKFLDEIIKDPYIADRFYLTGGTALAACYLNHRLSEDIDLFSTKNLEEQRIGEIVSIIAARLRLKIEYARIHDRLAYTIEFPAREKLKVDIVYYPYEPIEQSKVFYKNLLIDSIADIAVNKLMTISQRTASKDYVDLYFILKKYTVWDLMHGVAHKFHMDIEPLFLSSLFTNAELLNDLPVMKKKLTLEELKSFFLKEAKRLASTMVKP